MAGGPEDPIAKIADIGTFNLYTIGYRAKLVAEPPDRKVSSKEKIERASKLAASFMGGLSKALDLNEEPVEPAYFTESVPSVLILRGCPWNDVPPSVQEVLLQQLPSDRWKEKGVAVTILRNEIEFTPDDLRAELSPFNKVILVKDDRLGPPENIGLWIICTPPEELQRMVTERIEDERTSFTPEDFGFTKRVREYVKKLPVTLHQLHDVARLMEDSKGRASVLSAQQQGW